MKGEKKTRAQLIRELEGLRRRVSELEAADAERMRAEEELRKGEERYRAILENVNDLIFMLDTGGNITYMNPAVKRISGYTQAEVVGRDYAEFIYPEDLPGLRDYYLKTLKREASFAPYEYRIVIKDGAIRYVRGFGRPLEEEGKNTGLVGVMTDITDHINAERALRESEEYLRSIFDSTTDMFLVFDSEGKIVEANHQAGAAHGYSHDELMKLTARDMVHPDYHHLLARFSSQVQEGREFPSELVHIRKDLTTFDAEVRGTAFQYKGERRFLAVIRDITERKRAEEELARFKAISDHANYGIAITDMEGNLIYINEYFASVHGYRPDELTGKSLDIFHNQEQIEEVTEINRRLLETGGFSALEVWHAHRDGSVFPMLMNAVTIVDKRGNPLFMAATGIDITENKLMRERLEKLNRCFLSLGTDYLENIETLVRTGGEILGGACALYNRLERDRDLLCTWAIWQEPEGYDPEDDPKGHICYDVIVEGGDAPVVIGDLEGTKYERTDPNVMKYGLKSYLGYPVELNGEVVGSFCLCDVRKRKFAREEIELLGMLAKAISIEEERLAHERGLKDFLDIASHELRHPITIIKGYSHTLKKYEGRMDEELRREILEDIDLGADRLDKLVGELLDASRVERGSFLIYKQEVAVEPLVERAVEEMRQKGTGNEIRLSIPGDTGTRSVDPEKFIEVMTILLDNAVNYSPEGSEIDVAAGPDDGEMLISVLDRGPGVPEWDCDRVFERFYQVEDTLHHSSPGIGLGLYIAREIVEAHGGRIWCEAREGGGSAFHIAIP